MNTVYKMDEVGVYGNERNIAYECTDSLDAEGTGKVFLVPAGVKMLACTVKPTTASGKVQVTTDILETVMNGTITWVDWDEGDVSVTTQGACYPPTAFRLSQTGAGATVLTVRGQ